MDILKNAVDDECSFTRQVCGYGHVARYPRHEGRRIGNYDAVGNADVMILGFARKRRRPTAETLIDVRLRHFDERGMRFAKLRNARVLIYWPHGFGDFVHLGYLLPLLEPSNRYWIARYGDDFSALYRHNPYALMLPSGVTETNNIFGSAAHDFHLGLRYGSARGETRTLSLTSTLAHGIKEHGIDTVLWTDYPDSHGALRFPYHTKIRSLVRQLIVPERLEQFDLMRRLPHAVNWDTADAEAQTYVDDCLAKRFGEYSQLCLLQSGGHTAPHKHWEDAEILEFTTRFVAADERRAVVLLNDVAVLGRDAAAVRVAAWHEVFAASASTQGEKDAARPLAYARVIRALMGRTAVMIGVPAGPTHLALATGTVPTVGLWRAHHPLAYEEPNEYALHVISRSVRSERSGQWKLTQTVPPGFLRATSELSGTSIPAAVVYEAMQEVLKMKGSAK